jgi:hypothetical protein
MLMLKRASASRPSGEWKDDDYDVLADGIVVGRIFRAAASPEGSPWMWALAFGHHEDRTSTHGYEATREAAMAAFCFPAQERVILFCAATGIYHAAVGIARSMQLARLLAWKCALRPRRQSETRPERCVHWSSLILAGAVSTP